MFFLFNFRINIYFWENVLLVSVDMANISFFLHISVFKHHSQTWLTMVDNVELNIYWNTKNYFGLTNRNFAAYWKFKLAACQIFFLHPLQRPPKNIVLNRPEPIIIFQVGCLSRVAGWLTILYVIIFYLLSTCLHLWGRCVSVWKCIEGKKQYTTYT